MTQSLRIAVPIHSFEPGGVERVALGLATYWEQAGHDVTVVLGRDEGLDRGRVEAGLRYALRRSPVPTARFETLWMIWCFALQLRRERFDVIFCAGNTYAVVCVVMRLLMGEQCPPIVCKISNDLERRDMPEAFRRIYGAWLRLQGRLFDRFVALAEPMHAEIVRATGAGAHRVVTIHDPALTRARFEELAAIARPRKSAGPEAGGCRFLTLARLVPQKNIAMMLHAFAQARQTGDTLAIVGDGPERERLQALVARLELDAHVTFVGHVLDPDPYLAEADCLLLSSDYEGVPAVVLEAIAAGLRIIATDCSSSMAMLMGCGAHDRLVPVGDVAAFASEIRHIDTAPLSNPDRRALAARFTLENAAGAYLAAMNRAIADARHIRIQMTSPLPR